MILPRMMLTAKIVFLSALTLLALHVDASMEIKDGPLKWMQQHRRVNRKCPCQNESLCETPITKQSHEVVVFILQKDPSYWMKYDWTKITTAVVVGMNAFNPLMVCQAHKYGAKLVMIANIAKKDLTDFRKVTHFVVMNIMNIVENYMDGINFDFEDSIDASDRAHRDGLNNLVQFAYTNFKSLSPNLQVSIDLAWSPDCIDDRCYDTVTLAKYTDFIFVMSYDEQSQIQGPCVALANSPYDKTMGGLQAFLKLKIPPSKLVLGLPWYGYRYPCINVTKDNVCSIKHVPFRGVNCSDAAGSQINYAQLPALLNRSTTGLLWDETALSPYFNIKDVITGQIYQYRYDDPRSLTFKYKLAVKMKLLGVGMWNADALDYSDTDAGKKQRKEMWGALPDPHKWQPRYVV